MTQEAICVVGLGYGDEGKGSIVDYLTREYGSKLNVRFNGGAQCAHNVVTPEGKHHRFAQFGSGTLAPSAPVTYLSRHVIVNPLTLPIEAVHLQDHGIEDPLHRVYVENEALITNPFQMAANRLREQQRGAARHGSCGMGIGETVADALADSDMALRWRDLRFDNILIEKLRLSLYKKRQEFGAEFEADFDAHSIEKLATTLRDLWRRTHGAQRDYLRRSQYTQAPVIFEGAQGVMLDQDYGFAPHTTWSKTTLQNSDELLSGLDYKVRKIGVMRAYMTRHGHGPLVTETQHRVLPGEHNQVHEFQGEFRLGLLDLPLLKYATERCPVDELAVTCLDHVQYPVKVCTDYNYGFTASAHKLRQWPHQLTTLHRERELLDVIEDYLELPVTILSHGPTCNDKKRYAS
jgi:adenylosuccinate synthase